MEIKALTLGSLQVNCYLVLTNKAAVVIDPGFDSQEVAAFLSENQDKERVILLTHAHFDHIGAAPDLREKYGVKIAIGEIDNPALSDSYLNMAEIFGIRIPRFSADILLKDGDELTVGDLAFKVIHTPGHTKGSVSYLCDDVLFSGDTLFYASVGRTDFIGGDFNELSASIKRLYLLPDSTEVLPGHGGRTTIKHEKLYNPFVRN